MIKNPLFLKNSSVQRPWPKSPFTKGLPWVFLESPGYKIDYFGLLIGVPKGRLVLIKLWIQGTSMENCLDIASWSLTSRSSLSNLIQGLGFALKFLVQIGILHEDLAWDKTWEKIKSLKLSSWNGGFLLQFCVWIVLQRVCKILCKSYLTTLAFHNVLSVHSCSVL